MAKERDETGKFNREYEDDEFISAVASLSVASTQAVADEVGCSYDLAYRRLQDLEEQGQISVEKVGGSFVWLEE